MNFHFLLNPRFCTVWSSFLTPQTNNNERRRLIRFFNRIVLLCGSLTHVNGSSCLLYAAFNQLRRSETCRIGEFGENTEPSAVVLLLGGCALIYRIPLPSGIIFLFFCFYKIHRRYHLLSSPLTNLLITQNHPQNKIHYNKAFWLQYNKT